MIKNADLIWHAARAINMLDRGPRSGHPYEARLYDKLRYQTRTGLRKAVAAVVDDLDVDLVSELMKLIKKLRGGEQGSTEFDRVKTALDLLEHTLDKKRPESPDSIHWKFNEIYRRLGPIEQQERTRNQAQ